MAFDLRPLLYPPFFPWGILFLLLLLFRDTPYSLVYLIPSSINRVDHDFQVSPPNPVIPVTDALTVLV